MAGSRHLNAFKCSLQNRKSLILLRGVLWVMTSFLGLGFHCLSRAALQSLVAVTPVDTCTIQTVFRGWQAIQSLPVEKEMQVLECVFLLQKRLWLLLYLGMVVKTEYGCQTGYHQEESYSTCPADFEKEMLPRMVKLLFCSDHVFYDSQNLFF